ncbi:MAG: hypothetical protein KKB51_16805 [Candidatus Riflebacteria bacterium]|nr:hypothetical protein [Candidatus Riflebacteria bacterium]
MMNQLWGQTEPALLPIQGSQILVSQVLQPSASEQTVTWNNQVTVKIPGGLVKTPSRISITKIDNPTIKAGLSVGIMNSFDICLGNDEVFEKPLTLEFSYDPTMLPSNLPAHKSVFLAWWNPKQTAWHITPSQVDEKNCKIIVKTQHLTVWSTIQRMRGWDILDADNFIIAYQKSHHPELHDITPPQMEKILRAAEKKGQGRDSPGVKKTIDTIRKIGLENSPVAFYAPLTKNDLPGLDVAGGDWPEYARDPKLPPYVRDTAVFLNLAYDKYSKAGFRMPSPQVNVEVSPSWFRGTIFKEIFTGADANNSYTGIIGIGFNSSTWQALCNASAHELFHSVQNQYYWDFGMSGSRLWWIEASAEAAASLVDPKLPVLRSLSPDYLARPITTIPTREGDEHHYETMHFLTYVNRAMAGTLASFRGYFEQVVAKDPARGTGAIFAGIDLAKGSDTSLTLRALETGTYQKTRRSLSDFYREFAGWMAFSQESACRDISPEKIATQDFLIQIPEDPEKFSGANRIWTADLPPNYAAQILRVHFSARATGQIRLKNALFPGSYTDVYLLRGAGRVSDSLQLLGSLFDLNSKVESSMLPADSLYVVAVNTTNQRCQVAVEVKYV